MTEEIKQKHFPFTVQESTTLGNVIFLIVNSKGCFVTHTQKREEAEFIVESCNSHYKMREALEKVEKVLVAAEKKHWILGIVNAIKSVKEALE